MSGPHAYAHRVIRLKGCANDHVWCCTQSGMDPEVPAFKGSYTGGTGFAARGRAAPAAPLEAGATEEDGSDHGGIDADPADLQLQEVRHSMLMPYVLLFCVCLCSLAAREAALISIPVNPNGPRSASDETACCSLRGLPQLSMAVWAALCSMQSQSRVEGPGQIAVTGSVGG